MVAKTIRAITDTVSLTIEADDLIDASIKSEQVLDVFPAAHNIEGVEYVYVDHRDYGEVIIMDLKQQEEDDDLGVA